MNYTWSSALILIGSSAHTLQLSRSGLNLICHHRRFTLQVKRSNPKTWCECVCVRTTAPWNHFPTNCGFLGAQKWSVKKGYTSAMLRCCCFFLLMHSMFCSELVTKCEIICTYLNLIVFLDFFFFGFQIFKRSSIGDFFSQKSRKQYVAIFWIENEAVWHFYELRANSSAWSDHEFFLLFFKSCCCCWCTSSDDGLCVCQSSFNAKKPVFCYLFWNLLKTSQIIFSYFLGRLFRLFICKSYTLNSKHNTHQKNLYLKTNYYVCKFFNILFHF